jgi:hypothetical protein
VCVCVCVCIYIYIYIYIYIMILVPWFVLYLSCWLFGSLRISRKSARGDTVSATDPPASKALSSPQRLVVYVFPQGGRCFPGAKYYVLFKNFHRFCRYNNSAYNKKVKVSQNRPRWPKGFRVG